MAVVSSPSTGLPDASKLIQATSTKKPLPVSDDYRAKLEEAAARTRDVQGLDPATASYIGKAVSKLETTPGTEGATSGSQSLAPIGKALESNLKTQEADLKKRAEGAASALEIAGGAAITGAENIAGIQESLRGQAGQAAASFGAAAEKADEYVQAARGRVQAVLSKVDQIYEDINKSNDFSKSHDMQSAVQASLGSMRAEERNIAQTYGADSAEYQQFKMQKSNSLGVVQSDIHSTYAKLKIQMDATYLSTVSDAYAKGNTGVSYQEQQHVDMLKFQAQTQSAYNLQVAQLDTALEQMKTAGYENLANWILETPTFSMDASATVAAISDLLITQENMNQAGKLNKAQTDLTSAQAEQTKTWADYMSGKRPNVYKSNESSSIR